MGSYPIRLDISGAEAKPAGRKVSPTVASLLGVAAAQTPLAALPALLGFAAMKGSGGKMPPALPAQQAPAARSSGNQQLAPNPYEALRMRQAMVLQGLLDTNQMNFRRFKDIVGITPAAPKPPSMQDIVRQEAMLATQANFQSAVAEARANPDKTVADAEVKKATQAYIGNLLPLIGGDPLQQAMADLVAQREAKD